MSPPAGDEVETEEQTKLLASDFLGLPHEGSSVLEPYVLPQVEDTNMQLQMEDEIYFYPTNDPGPLEDKIDGETPIRRLEEEGLFVGDPPSIPLSWQNRLEQRLLVAGDKHWFGNDGRLKTLSDPLLSTAFHPPLYNAKLNPALKLKYKPNIVSQVSRRTGPVHSENCVIGREANTYNYLNLVIIHKQDSPITIHFFYFISILFSPNKSGLAVTSNCNKIYSAEIGKVREWRLREGGVDRALTARLLRAWHELKQLRERQRFASSKLAVQIYTQHNGASPFSLPDEMRNEIRNQVAELEAEAWEEYNQKMEEYKQKWNEWKRESKTKNNSDQEPNPPMKPDLQNLQSDVSKLVSDCIRPPDEPPIVLQLIEETPSMDISDTTEQQRRSLVKRCQIALRILYNGQEVCQTLPQSLDQTFKVTFNQLFAIRILHWPQTFSIELIMDGKRNVAEIFIPIPSSGVTLDSATVEQLVFSSDRVVRPLGVGAVGAGVEFSIFPGGALLCPYTSGVVTCRVGWGREEGVVLCPPEKYLPATVRSR
ncbi:hypothetical protein LSTR_LSTR014637 [Laodelphax striatellus]|uniref:CC2D2A N-terminal C2 domain-containing protein n=1 Tax=Laodelphax striatellus TaxID=195883 RepID=A0A482WFZ9_LAOST|nr:hypothetical protein LSTR_LSTR014637 [Laodelphax striatellus]